MKKKGSNGIVIARGTGDGLYVSCPEAPFARGDRVAFVVREDAESTERLLDKQITEFTDDGKAYVSITEEDSLSLEAGEYVYGVNVIRAGAEPVALIREAAFVVEEGTARDE